ncbi:MAG: hypothetical protein ACJAW1_000336 [Glaciecola sp.]|jgi:hypothetical protein
MHLQDTPVEIVHNGIDGIVQFGFPIQKGQVWHAQHIDLLLDEVKLKCDRTPSGCWEDQSIRWLEVQAVVEKSGTLTLEINNTPDITPSTLCQSETLTAQNDNTLYTHQSLPLSMLVELTLAGHVVPIKMSDFANVLTRSKLTSSYEVSGAFVFEGKKLLLICTIRESALTGEIFIEARLHNPAAAAHVGGKWDLGDKNSVIIDDFSIIFASLHSQTKLLLDQNALPSRFQVVESENFSLSQFGSGGENWQSPIHWNEHKQSTVEKQGFELLSDDGKIKTGLRAEPTLHIENEDAFIQIALDGFWQNFPVVLNVEAEQSKWQLLSKNTELQGGESKTWKIKCRSGKSEDIERNSNLLKPNVQPEVRFNASYINRCDVIPNIALSNTPSKLSEFIALGVEGKHSFFNKRENKDVYGWRNYGELDADHEAVNAPLDSCFISHYNNQYDPLMGMTLQFLHANNTKWLDLIQPLNQHIQDIDIYDTTQDKAEYNGGLMWHTDHYLSAETCTHRSNSKYHQHAYDGFLGGGGPGGQHCYTMGLTLQYRFFSDKSAKDKVIQLCNWVRCFYNGSGSIAERTFRLLTIDFKQNVLTNIGMKAPGYKYPLDRGTGNYLNALLDCFDVTGNPCLMDEMGQLVRSTFHPNEDIELRDLNNIEKSWFYTVYLQAVVKYLLLKETRDSIDEDYWYARYALIHYGKWMLSNEDFYLRNADELEFPNDTWCAQDTRKMNLFCWLYYFDEIQPEIYLHKANEYYQYIVEHLSMSDETHFARILAILMQNDGVSQKFGLDDSAINAPKSSIPLEKKSFNDAPIFSRYAILTTYFRDVTHLIRHFSLASECRWLSLRVKSVLNK